MTDKLTNTHLFQTCPFTNLPRKAQGYGAVRSRSFQAHNIRTTNESEEIYKGRTEKHCDLLTVTSYLSNFCLLKLTRVLLAPSIGGTSPCYGPLDINKMYRRAF